MKKEMLRLIIRIMIDIVGIAIDVYIRCVWKPLNLPNVIAGILSLAAVFILLFDILRCFVTILDIYAEE